MRVLLLKRVLFSTLVPLLLMNSIFVRVETPVNSHSDNTVVLYLGDVSAKQPSTIDCIFLYAEVPLGSAITITWSIEPTPLSSDSMVTLSFTRPDDTVLNRTVPIAVDGTYDDLFAPDMVGVWRVVASWPGDAALDGAISATRTFTLLVPPPGFPLELVIALGILVGITIGIAFYTKRHIMYNKERIMSTPRRIRMD